MNTSSSSKGIYDLNFNQCTLVHHLDSQLAITSTGRTIKAYTTPDTCKKIRLPFKFPRDLSLGIRYLERFLRADKCLAVPHGDAIIIIRGGTVYLLKDKLETLGEIKGDCPLHASSSIGQSGSLYFGEYFMNPQREPVKIFKINHQTNKLSVAHSFAAGEIRHVHGIYRDPYLPNHLWITVGDNDGECYLYWTDDEFVHLSRIGDGTQIWRAVGLLFTADKIIWGTDSPHQPNHFVALDRKTQKLEIRQPVDGTIWYAGKTNDGTFFASSSVEKGPGVTTNQARVYTSRDGIHWENKISFTKDCLPMPLFKWGTISFPSGSFPSNRIWISGEALQGLDGTSQLLPS